MKGRIENFLLRVCVPGTERIQDNFKINIDGGGKSEYNSARRVAVYDAARSSALTMFTPVLASRRIIQRFNYGRGAGG